MSRSLCNFCDADNRSDAGEGDVAVAGVSIMAVPVGLGDGEVLAQVLQAVNGLVLGRRRR